MLRQCIQVRLSGDNYTGIAHFEGSAYEPTSGIEHKIVTGVETNRARRSIQFKPIYVLRVRFTLGVKNFIYT